MLLALRLAEFPKRLHKRPVIEIGRPQEQLLLAAGFVIFVKPNQRADQVQPGLAVADARTETVRVSPGIVGLEKRERIIPKRAGSEPQTEWSRARPVKP